VLLLRQEFLVAKDAKPSFCSKEYFLPLFFGHRHTCDFDTQFYDKKVDHNFTIFLLKISIDQDKKSNAKFVTFFKSFSWFANLNTRL